MQYLEELKSGDCFEYNSSYYILSSDFKNNGSRMCLSLVDGFTKWLKGDCIVNLTDIFTLDKDTNIIAIRKREKDDNTQNQNIS
jgi:hypothetical protein